MDRRHARRPRRAPSRGHRRLGWFEDLWDTLTEISIGYVILGCFFQGLQTSLTALGWYGILRYAYPGGVTYMPVLAAYAAGVALNNFVPANMGTFVTLLMYVAIVQGATFPGVLGGYVVQKIFYLVIGTLIYIYLFSRSRLVRLPVRQREGRDLEPPRATLGIIAGATFLIAILLRIFWRWVKKMWAKAVEGAAILRDLRAYVKRVLLPQMGGYAAKVMVIIVFLAAYGIPVTFGSVMSVLGSNQLANLLSFTPAGSASTRRSTPSRSRATRGHDGDGLLHRAAADHDGVQRRLRDRAHLRRLRLAGRLEARQGLLHDAKVKKDEMSEDRQEKRRRSARREPPRATGLMRFRERGRRARGHGCA